MIERKPEGTFLDLSAKYFWTRQSGASVTIHGDSVKFEDVNSRRVRLGGRYAKALGMFSPYAGLAYERELDGKAKATVNGDSIDAPSLKGSTGIGELGLALAPWENTPLSFDFGLQGYAGKHQGWTGSLQIRYVFE